MIGRVLAPFGSKKSRHRHDDANAVTQSKSRIHDSYTIRQGVPKPGSSCAGVHKETGIIREVRARAKKEAHAIKQEIDAMRALESHPHIVSLFDVFEDSKSVYLVVEPCDGGWLKDSIPRPGGLSEAQAAFLLKQLLGAVRHMHRRSLVHRNLQLGSLSLKAKGPVGSNSVLKVGGFELACVFRPDELLTAVCGPIGYMAPEVSDKEYSSPCDVWSCGVLTFIFLCGQLPFGGGSDEEIARESYRGAFFFHPRDWASVSELAKDLIRALLRTRPAQRWSAAEALRHRWFKEAVRSLDFDDTAETAGLGANEKDPQFTTLLDLELDSAPQVDRDIFIPIQVNRCLKPTLLTGTPGDATHRPAGPPANSYELEPWGRPMVQL